GFSGYLLPWNQIAVNATKVGLQSLDAAGQYLPSALASLPHLLRETIQGDTTVGQATLSRFYALHVVVLPLSCLALLGGHLLSVQLHGMSDGIDGGVTKSEKFFPDFLIRDLSFWAVCFFALMVLSVIIPFDSFLPFPMLEPYNALGATPPGIKPEWYFYFIYYPLEILPFWMVMLVSTASVLVLFLTPWLFKTTPRKVLRAIAAAAATYLFVITVFGAAIYKIVRPGG
ncbi:MAG TPA: cytochrome b N-terminal domain-containing protein, partial [Chroococcales cyanobacterium]